MTIYYQDDLITLHHGDCLDIENAEWLSADVLVTDPPYGMAYVSNFSKYNGPSDAIINDDSTKLRDAVLNIWGNKSALVFGTWKVNRPENVKQLIIWDKGESPGMGDLTIPWGPSHEKIYVMGNSDYFTGKRGGAVIRVNRLSATDARRPNHPTPKPIGLMERLIEKTVGVVADPFAGSGATLLAARNLGKKAIGVEIDEQYCELIATRLGQQAFMLDEMMEGT